MILIFLQKNISNIEYEVPNIDTSPKFYTDYNFYNINGTPHKRLQNSEYTWTDEQGLRRFNNDYIVALGSYYSTSIGDRFEVELDNGNIFTIIFGDGKWDIDCDVNNMYTPCKNFDNENCGNLLEFIVDETKLCSGAIRYGSVDYYDNLKGNVVRITYLGRDISDDWDIYL